MKIAFKKMKALYVYEMLLRANKPLTLTEINTKLRVEYGIDETEKTQRDLLYDMMDADIIKGVEKKRKDHLKGQEGHNEDEAVFYIGYELKERAIDDKELSWLIDNVRFSKQLSEEKAERMISRLLALGSGELRKKVQSERKSRRGFHADGDRFFDNLDVLKAAVKDQKSIRFMLLNYASTKPQLLPVQEDPLFVKPVTTGMTNDFHYLIAFDPQGGCLQHYRIDRMKEIEIAVENIDYDVLNRRPDVDDYLWTHSLMRTGKKETVKVRLPDDKLDLVIDRFGAACRLFDYGDDDDMIVTLQSNAEDLFVWALENGEYVEVLEPLHIRNRVRKAVEGMMDKYLVDDSDRYYDALQHAQDSASFHCLGFPLNTKSEWLELDHIDRLILEGNKINDLAFIERFPHLKEIRIYEKALKDITPLRRFSRLHTFVLDSTRVETLDILSGIEIENLRLFNNSKIKDYSPLYEMRGLVDVHVDKQTASMIDINLFKYSHPTVRVYDPDEVVLTFYA